MISDYFLSFLLFAMVVAFFAIDYGFMNRYDRERASRKGWSWDYTLFTIGIGALVIFQPWLFPSLGWTSKSPMGLVAQFAGLLLIIAALSIHVWARKHLQKFYVERVEVQADHRLINTGPYAYVRHPIISTFFGLAFGILLLNPSIVTIFLLAYTVWDFSRAAKEEEKLLSEAVTGYSAYAAATPRFFPKIGRRI